MRIAIEPHLGTPQPSNSTHPTPAEPTSLESLPPQHHFLRERLRTHKPLGGTLRYIQVIAANTQIF